MWNGRSAPEWGGAANTNRKGYSRPVVLGSSVNVIADPVRVAPIPKVIAHVPTNIIITTSGANNLQLSWRFDWEPPKAVLRDV